MPHETAMPSLWRPWQCIFSLLLLLFYYMTNKFFYFFLASLLAIHRSFAQTVSDVSSLMCF